MDITEFLNFADHLVFTKTQKHLTTLQKKILQGVWHDQDFPHIAKNVNLDQQHIRNTASKLYKIISKSLGETVNKSNIKAALERQITQNVSLFHSNNNNYVGIGTLNICRDCLMTADRSLSPAPTETISPQQDLTKAPVINQFYGRDTELQTLENNLLNPNINLFNLYGIIGIGKSHLAKRFIDLHSSEFDIIIWRSLQFKPFVNEFINDILHFVNGENDPTQILEKNLSKLIEILEQKRCLIVIDDLQNILANGQLSGEYEKEYQCYQKLFTTIITNSHKSCFLLISQEELKEINQLKKDYSLVNSLEVKGLEPSAAREILTAKKLQQEEQWLQIINLYQGHPQWLKWIADLIQELGNGYITNIFTDDAIIFTEEIEDSLKQVFSRLSAGEKQIMIVLAKQDQPLTIMQLKEIVQLSQNELVNGLRSLLRRCLIITKEELYYIQPVLCEFMIRRSPMAN
jgi:AAA+ ATPase superfamily predicted ATPase